MTTSARESQHLDRKSLREVTGSTADFGELARNCVCFANGAGGAPLIGIEDDEAGLSRHLAAGDGAGSRAPYQQRLRLRSPNRRSIPAGKRRERCLPARRGARWDVAR